MGLFGFMKDQLIDIVEWNQTSESDVMAWRFPRHDNEIKNGARLIVREGQVAVFVNMGQIADMFGPGMHVLSTKNLPILSNLLGWKYGFESPFKAEVYFVATRRFLDLKWGTANPVMMRDKEFGMIRVRAYGTYAIQVSDSAKFLREIIATDPQLQTFEVSGQLRRMIVTRLSDAIASSGLPALDMAANLDELSDIAKEKVSKDFGEMGISVPVLLVESISLPGKVEEALDKRTSMGMLGNLDQYMKYQAAEAMTKAAENPGGGMASMGAGMGAGYTLAQQMVGAMSQPSPHQPVQQPQASAPAPPPIPASVTYYAALGGQQAGPFDPASLQAQVAAGSIKPDTLVWKNGMANWTPAKQVDELKPLFQQAPPPLPPPPPAG